MSILNNRIGGTITNSTVDVHGVINTNIDINNPPVNLNGVNLPFTTPGSTPGNILVTDGSNILAWSELKTINGSSVFGSGDLTIGGGGVIDITHADLVIAKNTSSLSSGTFYRITDFRTMYDQPDYDTLGNPKSSVAAKQGPIEPIIVLALKNNLLSTKVQQEAYPLDTIEYILEFTTPFNNTVTKGRIIYRKDEFGNEVDFDFRNVLFKRYLDPYIQEYISYKDTSLASIELPLFPTFMNYGFNSNNIKFVGYFNRYTGGNVGGFDMPNTVIKGPCKDATLGYDTVCSTFKSLQDVTLSECEFSAFDINIISSIITNVNSSTLYSAGGEISNCNIGVIQNSVIGILQLSHSSITKLLTCNIGNLSVSNSNTDFFNVGTANPIGLPIDAVSISSSNLRLLYVTGIVTISNSYFAGISQVDFISNSISNTRGGLISDCIMKPNGIILDLNILGNLQSIDFSSSTIIYDTTLSKEIIKHPNGLYIKHYDQFGAAIINNITV